MPDSNKQTPRASQSQPSPDNFTELLARNCLYETIVGFQATPSGFKILLGNGYIIVGAFPLAIQRTEAPAPEVPEQ